LLSNQTIQKLLQEIKRISGYDCSVWNEKAECMAATNIKAKPQAHAVTALIENYEKTGSQEETGDESLFLVESNEHLYILAMAGTDDKAVMAGRFGISHLESLASVNRSKMDKNRFIQSLILDNLLLVDIYNQAKRLKIPVVQRRVVFLVEPQNAEDTLVLETLKGMFAIGIKDFATSIEEKHIILVKALEPTEGYDQIQHMADVIVDTLGMEAMVGVRISYGTIVEELKDVSRSYKEADMAMEVGRVFYSQRRVLSYKVLGIGRLIHQLPASLCEMFLDEVFEGNAMDNFEEEELTAVYTFFENNLNISETARKLYVHRNTLVYRLEKIQKKTGLDVRVFEDAMTFKIALMVEKHMRAMKEKNS
jgi:carbohydrate diacid regulator